MKQTGCKYIRLTAGGSGRSATLERAIRLRMIALEGDKPISVIIFTI